MVIEESTVSKSTVVEEFRPSIIRIPTMGTELGSQNSTVFDMAQSSIIEIVW